MRKTLADFRRKIENEIRLLRRIHYILDDTETEKAFNKATNAERLGVIRNIEAKDTRLLRKWCLKIKDQKLDDKTVVELRILAQKLRLPGYSMLTKQELIREILHAQRNA